MQNAARIVTVRQGDKYGVKYTHALRHQLASHGLFLTVLGDGGDADVLLRHGLKGWWSKMELFAPDVPVRPCFFLDLDTIVLKPIDDMLEDTGDLWLIRDFFQPNRSNSGLMKIPKDTSDIWDRFKRGTDLKGDGDFLNRFPHRVLQDAHNGIVSYKANHCQSAPKGRVVCFHGKPKPHECDGWVKRVWNSSPS